MELGPSADEQALWEKFKAVESKKKEVAAAKLKTSHAQIDISDSDAGAGPKAEKRKRPHTDVDERPRYPSPPMDILGSKKPKQSTVKKGKKVDAPVDEVVFEDRIARGPKLSPEVCEVMDPKVQDKALKVVYKQGLPNLFVLFRASRASLISWSDKDDGPGMFMFSSLESINPGIDIRQVVSSNLSSAWSFVNFVSEGQTINLARVSPKKLESSTMILGNDDRRSSLLEVNSESGKQNSSIPMMKFVKARFPSQEFDRVVGICGMVFNLTEMHAQIERDSVTIATKSVYKDQLKSDTSSTPGIRSSSSRSRTAATTSKQDVLPTTANMYDGRNGPLDAYEVLADVNTLPRYTEGEEIPENSCAVVAYTVTQYKYRGKNNKPDEERINFNIQWAIVLGEPE
ncbi:hypothetical protein B0H12DRAFT_1083111 [Mycena haematopus]|nr:hypothetical protein B0H12DRAFT_1083111 [Mycena haematopus]